MYKNVENNSQIPEIEKIYFDILGYRENGFFIEAGAFDGWNWSPVSCLALAGWSGLFAEPNPEYFNKCYDRWKDNNKIIMVNCALGDFEGETDLFLDGSTSTTKKETIDIYNYFKETKIGWSPHKLSENEKIKVPITKIDTLLEKYNIEKVNVFVIDVEGAEIDVLNGFSIDKYNPEIMIVEAHDNFNEKLNYKTKEIDNYFKNKNYKKYWSNYINTIYTK